MGKLELAALVGWLGLFLFYFLWRAAHRSALAWQSRCIEVGRKCERDHPDNEPIIVRRRHKDRPDEIVSVRCVCGQKITRSAWPPMVECVECGRHLSVHRGNRDTEQ